jgi:sodium-dependent dicarboxylate transporter 2/3/5
MLDKYKNLLYLLIGPFLLIASLLILPFFGLPKQEVIIIGIVAWMVSWWITDIVPMAMTALLPIALIPLTNIESIKSITSHYAHPIVFLFMGGFFLASAMQKSNLHKRIAFNIIKFIGTDTNHIIAGFMVSTAFLSMWISNTATAVIMLPIALAVLKNLPSHDKTSFSTALMLSIAYAANIGGTATLIGTPTNAILVAFMYEKYNYSISFAKWLIVGLPFALSMLFFCWLLLTKILFPNKIKTLQADIIHQEVKKLGNFSKAEKIVTAVFLVTASLWILRAPFNVMINAYNLPLGELSDTSIAIAASIALFMLPIDLSKKKFALDWQSAKNIPWGLILLFGGGLTIASMLSNTMLISNLGQTISNWNFSPLLMIILVTALTLFLTELMSNMALTALFLPVVAAISLSSDSNILYLAIPVSLAASCAFMMPIATPPNAIIFASNRITVLQMMRAGLILNIISVIIISLLAHFLIGVVFSK